MKISVNGKEQTIEQDQNLDSLLQKLNAPTQGIAVAVNQQVIAQSEWQQHILNDQDQILIIGATQGG